MSLFTYFQAILETRNILWATGITILSEDYVEGKSILRGLQFEIIFSLAEWPKPGYLNSSSLSFLMINMGIIVVLALKDFYFNLFFLKKKLIDKNLQE